MNVKRLFVCQENRNERIGFEHLVPYGSDILFPAYGRFTKKYSAISLENKKFSG
jgi:hypothetical protein